MKLSERQARWVTGPVSLFLRMLGRTWRVRKLGSPCSGPEPDFVDAFCHGHMLFYISLYRGSDCVTMISEHRDGQFLSDVVNRFGGSVARGSSTRGGARAYLEMLKKYQDVGWVVTPDGPRGPRGSVHEGVIKMASDSNRAIRPFGYAVGAAKRLPSWDQFTIPYPFARFVQFVGDPLHVLPKIDRKQRKEFAKDLERRLAEASRQAELALSQWLRIREPEVSGQEQST